VEQSFLDFRGWLWDQHFGLDHHFSHHLVDQLGHQNE
jgi:hypothetical protein